MIEEQSGDTVLGTASSPLAGGAQLAVPAAAARVRSRARLRPDERAFLWISRLIVWVFLFIVIFPVAGVVIASFTAGSSFFVTSLIPQHFTLDHYHNVLDPNLSYFPYWVKNTLIVTITTGVLAVALVATTGYAFSRFRFYGRKYGLMAMLLVQMFPAQMSFIAFYFLLFKLHLLNHLYGLILVYVGGGIPFQAWLFKGYVDGLPRELEESAYVDGATKWQAFWKIILPLTRPMMAVIFLFQVIGLFNEFILASWLLDSSGPNTTAAVGLQGFIYNQLNQNWNDFAAGALVLSLPIMIIFLAMQKWLVAGLAAGAVKG
jgi:arabinogalactan oligomer/maltooligosaccharide transport system permease protein